MGILVTLVAEEWPTNQPAFGRPPLWARRETSDAIPILLLPRAVLRRLLFDPRSRSDPPARLGGPGVILAISVSHASVLKNEPILAKCWPGLKDVPAFCEIA